MPIYGIYALNWLCIPIYLAFGGSTQSHWWLHAVSGGSMRSHWRLHAESIWGSMRGHSAAPCGVIRRLHAESFGGSMRSHSVAPCGVICRLQAESFVGSAASHLVAPSRAIIPVARIGTPSLIQNSVALL